MSRSYKKVGGWIHKDKWFKNYSNRRLRRASNDCGYFETHAGYKRYNCSWDICDTKWLFMDRLSAEVFYTEVLEYDKDDLSFERFIHKKFSK